MKLAALTKVMVSVEARAPAEVSVSLAPAQRASLVTSVAVSASACGSNACLLLFESVPMHHLSTPYRRRGGKS